MRTATAPALVVVTLLALSSACATRAPVSYSPARVDAPAPVLHVATVENASTAPEETPDVRALRLFIDVEGLGLFDEERRQAEEIVAAWAESEGLDVVAPERAAEVFARARRGQHVDTGAACGISLSRWRAAQRWRSALGAEGKLRASVGCEPEAGDCTLVINAYDDVDFGGNELLVREAPFDRSKPWQASLKEAVGALVEPPAAGGSGGLGGILGSFGGGVVEAKAERLRWSAWPARDSEGAPRDDAAFRRGLSFPKGDAPLRACFAQDRAGAELLVHVDKSGRVARCASREADDEVSLCACEAFARHARGAPVMRSRRAYVGLHFDPADVVTPANLLVTTSLYTYLDHYRDRRGRMMSRPSVSDRSIEDWRPPADSAVARCFADGAEPGSRKARVIVRFDEQGEVSAVEVNDKNAGDPSAALSHEQVSCVQRAFSTSRAPCPAVSTSSAQADVTVLLRRVGEKMSLPFEDEGE